MEKILRFLPLILLEKWAPTRHSHTVFANASSYLRDGEMIHEDPSVPSALLRMNDGVAVKMFPNKGTLMTIMRGLLKQTKAHKQHKSACTIAALGLHTPAPLDVLVFSPRGKYESAYLYEFLEDARDFLDVFTQAEMAQRQAMLDQLAKELVVMAKEGVLFIDFHLSNIMVDAQGKIWWIDPEVKTSTSYVKARFWQRMHRMHTKCNPGVLSDQEWQAFQTTLQKEIESAGLRIDPLLNTR
ncbi:MAG: lipopolysaccharide kinase InaA family protein [Akkermansiaceae bacterium]